MKFQNLKIENFLTIGSIQCRLDDKGLVLIQGSNIDDTSQSSNGAGKSSFPDALSFCLYGTTARGESGDAVINRKAKKNCLVSVDILDNDETYRIIRHRKHHKEKNRLIVLQLDDNTGAITDLTKGTDKLTQDLVNKIIGCSAEVFNAAIYAGQEKMPDLPAMTDKQLKSLVEEAAGIDRLQQAEVEARNRLRDAKSEFSVISTEIEANRRAMERTRDAIGAAKRDIKAFDDNHKQKVAERTKSLKQVKVDFEALSKKADENHPKIQAIDEELVEIYDKLSNANKEKVRLQDAEVAVRKAERELAHEKAMVRVQVQNIEKAKRSLQQIGDRVGTPCGECGKPYKASDLKEARDIAEQHVEVAKSGGKALSEKAKQLAVTVSEAIQARDKIAQSMTDVSAENKRADELRADKQTLENILQQRNQKQRDLKRLLVEVKQLQAEENPYETVLEREQNQQKQLKAEDSILCNKRNKVEDNLRIKEMVCKVFGPAGVRAYILDTVTPFLNNRTSHYLSILTDGNIQATWSTLSQTKKGELREKFAIDVNSAVGAASFRGLSGGEKRKVRLACSMALQDLVSSRATKPIELYVADEIDHALDESGLERLMTILDEKAKDKGTVLVISHSDLSDWVRQQVTIVKESGESRMEGSVLA